MNYFKITSNYGHIHIGFLYLGWNNVPYRSTKWNDCGDETFGISIGNFYSGCYADGKWCAGFLNEYGYLE